MYEVIEEFVKFKLKEPMTIEDINTEINSFIFKKQSKRINISRNKGEVLKATGKGGGETEAFDAQKQPFYITHQWAGNENGFFTRFYAGVNAKYSDFQIKEL